ncbi:tight adherence protein B [Pseudidiomarina planktonica]|uniref:Tight adherence protein B n=1 Tax=Pseudidiomarina planktonica TaxID=1323738 RepID=A0A1Y6EUC6_9GAMM|nr:type II secretion system F family protein [Pseudidiomarina planktonica]RUO65612.1 hypothetical protein CWI77_03945 [Pseudidiomarina planktonica]SMQ64112.1 tight adherence protein B [Pseudidiomarina planktonica]
MSMLALVVAVLLVVSLGLIALALKQLAIYFLPRWRSEIESNTQRSLEELFLFIPVARLWLLWSVIALLLSSLILLWFHWWSAAIAILIWAALPPVVYRYYKQKRFNRIDSQLVDALHATANSLRSGVGFVSALEQVSKEINNPLQHELRLLVRQIRFGQSVVVSINEFAQRVPTKAVEFGCRVMSFGYENGGQQAQLLIGLAENLQAQLHLQQKMQSLTAQARMQGRIMAALPVAIFMLLHAVEPEHTDVLLNTQNGHLLLALSTALLCCGYMICRLILKDGDE